jgi:hypothetical protein
MRRLPTLYTRWWPTLCRSYKKLATGQIIYLLRMLSRFPPAITSLLLQFAAFAVVLASVHVFAIKPTTMAFACACGLVACGLSYVAKLDGWWLIIQFLFAPALVATLRLNISPDYFLALFVMLLLVFWNTFRAQVPLYLSSDKVWRALESFLPRPGPGVNFTFMDIGSGLGGVLTHLAGVRPDGNYNGVESAPLPFLWSWLRIRLGGYRQCRVLCGDLWHCDLAQYDVVFAYLSPAPMERLWHKARAEMRSGTVFISSTFAVPGQVPFDRVKIDDLHHAVLLVWRM